jgi:hypothetical protein
MGWRNSRPITKLNLWTNTECIFRHTRTSCDLMSFTIRNVLLSLVVAWEHGARHLRISQQSSWQFFVIPSIHTKTRTSVVFLEKANGSQCSGTWQLDVPFSKTLTETLSNDFQRGIAALKGIKPTPILQIRSFPLYKHHEPWRHLLQILTYLLTYLLTP